MINSSTWSLLLLHCTLICSFFSHFSPSVFLLWQRCLARNKSRPQSLVLLDFFIHLLMNLATLRIITVLGRLLIVLLTTASNMCTHWELAEGLGRKKSKPDNTSTQMRCKNEKDYEGEMGGRLHFLLILAPYTALRKRSGCLSVRSVSNREI